MIQEGKAEKALESLRKMTKLEAVVIRGGRGDDSARRGTGARGSGGSGCRTSGACRSSSCSGANLKIEESALTGESVPVSKSSTFVAASEVQVGDRKNMAFMTSYVTNGRARNRNGYRHGYGNRQDCRADS